MKKLRIPALAALVIVLSSCAHRHTLKAEFVWLGAKPFGESSSVRVVAANKDVEIRNQTTDGGRVRFTLIYPDEKYQAREPEATWAEYLTESDPNTAKRLSRDPAFQKNPHLFTVYLDTKDSAGFSVSAEQLESEKTLWISPLGARLSIGDMGSQENKSRTLTTIDTFHSLPDASYEEFIARWEDMGNPNYKNPRQKGAGHIIGLGWDGSIAKFGIDRSARVSNSLGNPDHFQFWFGLPHGAEGKPELWKSQELANSLPIVTTKFEVEEIRYEIEQFAYPLRGIPSVRDGEIPMVLAQKLKITNLTHKKQEVSIKLHGIRDLSLIHAAIVPSGDRRRIFLRDLDTQNILIAFEGIKADEVQWDDQPANHGGRFSFVGNFNANLSPLGSQEIIALLPSAVIPPKEASAMEAFNYLQAKSATRFFWENQLKYSAQFEVPEAAVNAMFRTTLWHALRLPQRHGAFDHGLQTIDFPYSNFAYFQKGSPWPILQSVYVDYMIYGLRGLSQFSFEELLNQFKSNQEPSGRISGYANWLSYTPGMIYAAAKVYRLSRD